MGETEVLVLKDSIIKHIVAGDTVIVYRNSHNMMATING